MAEAAFVSTPSPEGASVGTATRIGCLILAGIVGLPIVLGTGLLLAVASAFVLLFAADRAGVVDLDYWGYPDYIADAKPDGAILVDRVHCCGGSADGSGVTQFFYASDEPFAEVAKHYAAKMPSHSFRQSEASAWFTSARAVKFTNTSDPSICFAIVPFTAEYDLSDLKYRSVNIDRLRERLLASGQPYVGQFHEMCGG